jgi:hypothetical protein
LMVKVIGWLCARRDSRLSLLNFFLPQFSPAVGAKIEV